MKVLRIALTLAVMTAASTAALMASSCSGRKQKSIVIPGAPGSGLGTTSAGGTTVSPATAGATGVDPGLGAAQGAATSGVDPSSNVPSGGNGVLPPIAPPSAPMMTISTTLEDGTPASIQWDGQSYKGNDKWDLQAH